MDMTFSELQKRSLPRFFDRITLATDRLDEVVENLSSRYGMTEWRVEEFTPEVAENSDYEEVTYTDRIAVAKLGNVELCVTEPVSGNSPCAKYFARYGEGLCCVRENLKAAAWEREAARYRDMGIPVIGWEKGPEGQTVWFDMMDIFGGLFALQLDTRETAESRYLSANDRSLTQINITTDDADRTARQLAEILQIGPWSIGTLNNRTVSNGQLLVDGEYVSPEFSFQLAIHFYSNIEFEVIEPVKGPTVYQSYLDRHGIGYHHIKEVVAPEQLNAVVEGYRQDGFGIIIQGSVGPTTFAYLDSEKDFGFYVELGDGIPADPLPEGYNEYSYPAQEE